MKSILQLFLVFALINFSGGQQVLQSFFNSSTSELQREITASFTEEEIDETEVSNNIDEDEVEKEWMPVADFLRSIEMKQGNILARLNLILPDSESEDHSPPPERNS
ncbi:MAG: hypothetical protein L6Q81_04245 [Bacteroidia bacterium]|nr:hypothetical protein [Bacteroidia bacterium]